MKIPRMNHELPVGNLGRSVNTDQLQAAYRFFKEHVHWQKSFDSLSYCQRIIRENLSKSSESPAGFWLRLHAGDEHGDSPVPTVEHMYLKDGGLQVFGCLQFVRGAIIAVLPRQRETYASGSAEILEFPGTLGGLALAIADVEAAHKSDREREQGAA